MTTTATPATKFLPNVGPFNFVWADKFVSFGKMKFRVVGYCAYNAMGLIGTEYNGIAILSENDKAVVTDNIACATTYMEPTPLQRATFDRIVALPESEFKKVCLTGRSRYA
jgi:hypothetical protein